MRTALSLTLFLVFAVELAGGGLRFSAPEPPDPHVFVTSDQCMACHNGLTTPAGEDVSIGFDWRGSIMAHSSRDPYWHAAVRREVIDHPAAAEEIEDECSACHMPMANKTARLAGARGEVFAHLPIRAAETRDALLAADGVSCSVCHQIQPYNFGQRASFNGRFIVSDPDVGEARPIFGPYDVQPGLVTVMHSATGFQPRPATHIQQSELCATCHTLYTHTLGPRGEVVAELPEQVPYLEWLHSDYRETRSCQSCHMPVVRDPTPISSVLGEPRREVSRHTFVGANFFMLGMLNRYREDLGVEALPQELDTARQRTIEHLQTHSARLAVEAGVVRDGWLEADVVVTNLAGHKLPTAYPSRRAWLHVVVRDASGAVRFESGRFAPSGAIVGNDNDLDPRAFEPHHLVIDDPAQVQIYEGIMASPSGHVTTGLLTASHFIKDNRLLPHGFDKATAPADVAVKGRAAQDPDFLAGGDRTRYRVDVRGASGPFHVTAALWYQPIAYRWAENLRPYEAPETDRFTRYFDAMAADSAVIVVTTEAAIE